MMTINESLKILLNHSEFNPDDIEWTSAFNTITDKLGVFYDDRTNQFITKDTGDVI